MGPMKWTKTWWKRPIPLSEVLGEAVRKGFWPTRERLGEKFGVVFSKTVVVTETEHERCVWDPVVYLLTTDSTEYKITAATSALPRASATSLRSSVFASNI